MVPHRPLVLLLALTLTLGCVPGPAATVPGKPVAAPRAKGPGDPASPPTGGAATQPPGGLASPPPPGGLLAALPPRPPAPPEAARVIANNGAGVVVAGEVRLISDKGAAIVSNNSGGIVANNGGGIIANNGGGLVANNGGGLVSKTKYVLRQAPPGHPWPPVHSSVLEIAGATPEAKLAEAWVEVLDGAGRVLVGDDGRPIAAPTDADGRYRLEAPLPDENLVLRVRLFPNGGAAAAGGELQALLPRGAGERAAPLDTASTLGAAYVLATYVKGDPAVLAKLPAAEAAALRAEADAARGLLPADRPPSYRPAEMAAATATLRDQAPGLAKAIARIEALLVAGQRNLGAGLPPTQVPLTAPRALLGDGKGGLLIGESVTGRIRRLDLADPAAPMVVVAGEGTAAGNGDGGPAKVATIGSIDGLALAPDGAILIADAFTSLVRRIAPDGTISTFAGNGQIAIGALDGPATTVPLGRPGTIVALPDGGVVFGEQPASIAAQGRLLRVGPDGTIAAIPYPPAAGGRQPKPHGLVVRPDGTIFAYVRGPEVLAKLPPGGAWTTVVADVAPGGYGTMAAAADGTLYLSEYERHKIWKVAPDGTKTLVAGTGAPTYAADGAVAATSPVGAPTGLWVAPDGTLYFAEAGSNLVRAIGPDGRLRTVAGTLAVTQTGNALSIPVNGPGGMAIDGQGRLVLTETTSGTIKRLEAGELTVIAGTTTGRSGDGGPATAAQFAVPLGIAFKAEAGGEAMYVVDADNESIRRIGPDGVVSTIAHKDAVAFPDGRRTYPFSGTPLQRPMAIVIGPDGLPYWVDNGASCVWRRNADGTCEIVAGSAAKVHGDAGDGGPGADALFDHPTSCALGQDGQLYVADAGNLRVRAVDLTKPGFPVSAVAGLPKDGTLVRVIGGGGALDPEGTPALEAAFVAPTALAIDPAGDLYVTESGTARLGGFGQDIGIDPASLPKIPCRIRKVALGQPGRPVTTIAGPGGKALTATSGDDALVAPFGLVFDREGRLVLADAGTNQIKVLPAEAFR